MSTITHLADGVLLTGSAVAATNTHALSGLDQHTLYIIYSPDTDSTNALNVTVELSPDNTNWFNIGTYTNTSGSVAPDVIHTLAYPSDGTTDQLEVPYTFNGAAHYIRIKALETNAPGDYGNYSAWLISNNS